MAALPEIAEDLKVKDEVMADAPPSGTQTPAPEGKANAPGGQQGGAGGGKKKKKGKK